jgi:hypothetical protein
MSATSDAIVMGRGRPRRAQSVVVVAALVGALMFGVAIGRATAPTSSTQARTRAPVLTTANLSSANGERHLQVMRKMNRLLASTEPRTPTLVTSNIGEQVMRAMNRLSR